MKKDSSYGIIPYYLEADNCLFLLIQHTIGHWSFPKGHKEGSETHLEAATRELREETGISSIEVDISKPFIEKYTWNKDGEIIDKNVTFFLGKTLEKQVKIQIEEIQDYLWLPFAQAKEKLTYLETKQVFSLAYTYLTKDQGN